MRSCFLIFAFLLLGFSFGCSRNSDSAAPAPVVAAPAAANPARPAPKIGPNDLLFGKAPQDKIISEKLSTALDLYIAGKFDQCERLIRSIIAEFPLEAPPRVALARFLYSQKRFAEVEPELLTALRLKPAGYIFVDLGTLYAEVLDRTVDAVEAFNQAVLSDSRHAGSRYALGQLYFRLNQPDAALVELAKAGELSPQVAAPFIVRARVQIQQKRPLDALKECEEALRREPGNRIAFELMADVYNATAMDRAALDYYQRAVKSPDADVGSWTKLGMFHQSRGRTAEADAAYAMALGLKPDSALVLNNRAALSLVTGRGYPQATLWAREAVKLKPGNADFLDTLGELLLKQGDLEGARAALESAVAVAGYPSVKFHLAQTLHALGRPAPATELLREALGVNGPFAERVEAEELLKQIAPPAGAPAR